jgi:flagellar hook assembly protein FlgD
MIRILEFFGIDGVWTSTGENISESILNDLSVAPNPFRENVTVRFTIEESTWAAVEVYALNGSKVDEITSRQFDRGEHTITWNGTDREGRELPSGIYFLSLTSQELSITRKVVILR